MGKAVLVLSLFVFLAFLAVIEKADGEFIRVCYFTNWSHQRQNEAGRFFLRNIDPKLCTHLLYAFALINTADSTLRTTNHDDQIGPVSDRNGLYFNFTDLKNKNPSLKLLLSVGGSKSGQEFTTIANSVVDRQQFAKNCRKYVTDRNFDGLDIDWEFPLPRERDNFTALIKALHDEFQSYAQSGNKRLLLTIASAAGKDTIDKSFNLAELTKYVDFFNVMTYDYYGPWSSTTGFNSPLYSTATPGSFPSTLTMNWTLHRYISDGVPPQKIVMGLTAIAVHFGLKDPRVHGVGAQILKNITKKGSVLHLKGKWSYQGLCLELLDGNNFYKIQWDDTAKQEYAFRGTDWLGYETERSVAIKVQFARQLNLGGVMFWSLDLDDFKGDHCRRGRYPLLSAIRNATFAPLGPTTTSPTNGNSACSLWQNNALILFFPLYFAISFMKKLSFTLSV